jgi:hypothetical protein
MEKDENQCLGSELWELSIFVTRTETYFPSLTLQEQVKVTVASVAVVYVAQFPVPVR